MSILPPSRSGKARLLALLLVLVSVSFIYRAQVLYYYFRYSPREGDIVFQSLPHGDLVDAIEGITQSPYSHCGVVLREDSRWVVLEALGSVHTTPLLTWMQRGRGAGVAAYRLQARYDSLLPQFKEQLCGFSGKSYDYNFDFTDTEIYCSDLPFKAFRKLTGEDLGRLQKLGDLNWHPFQSYIKSIQSDRLPLERVMITPAALARAPQLHEVYRQGL